MMIMKNSIRKFQRNGLILLASNDLYLEVDLELIALVKDSDSERKNNS